MGKTFKNRRVRFDDDYDYDTSAAKARKNKFRKRRQDKFDKASDYESIMNDDSEHANGTKNHQ